MTTLNRVDDTEYMHNVMSFKRIFSEIYLDFYKNAWFFLINESLNLRKSINFLDT